MIKYDKFLNIIKEGLIRTHNIYNYSSSLINNIIFIGLDINIDIETKYRYKINVLSPMLLRDDEIYEHFFKINNNYGFYPILFNVERIDGMSKIFKFNESQLYEELTKNIKTISFIFDAKYDDSLYKNNIIVPDIVYHLSPTKNQLKIKNNGFYPKSNSRKNTHKDRLYVFFDVKDYNDILKSLKINDKLNQNNYLYDLYEITMDNNKNILHTDPDSNGYFTYDHISPKNIKIIKNKL